MVLSSARPLVPLLGGLLIWISPAVHAAERVTLVVGPFNRSVEVADLRRFSEGDEPQGFIKAALRLTNVPHDKARSVLANRVDVPFTLLGRLLYTDLGEAFLARMATIFYPRHGAADAGVPALRSGTILSVARSDTGKLNPIDFLESYPNKELVVDVPRLLYFLSRLNSIEEVTEFFREPF